MTVVGLNLCKSVDPGCASSISCWALIIPSRILINAPRVRVVQQVVKPGIHTKDMIPSRINQMTRSSNNFNDFLKRSHLFMIAINKKNNRAFDYILQYSN